MQGDQGHSKTRLGEAMVTSLELLVPFVGGGGKGVLPPPYGIALSLPSCFAFQQPQRGYSTTVCFSFLVSYQ